MMAVIGTLTFEFEVSLPLLARDTFGGTDTTYSWLIGALGAGAVIGGLYAARSQRTGLRRLTRAAAAYAVAVGLLAAAPTLPAAVAACAITGAASPYRSRAAGWPPWCAGTWPITPCPATTRRWRPSVTR